MARAARAGLKGPRPDLTMTGHCLLSFSAGSSKIKIRTSSCNKAQWALLHDEVRILIFDDPPRTRASNVRSFVLLNLIVVQTRAKFRSTTTKFKYPKLLNNYEGTVPSSNHGYGL
jgi:hypothetical protein